MFAATTCSRACAPSATRRNGDLRGSTVTTTARSSASCPGPMVTQSPTATARSRGAYARVAPASVRTVMAPRSMRDARPGVMVRSPSVASHASSQPRSCKALN